MSPTRIHASSQLANVRYEIRGPLARRAAEPEKAGHEIVKLNIGNPGAFGFRAPETMRLAMIENLRDADPYCHQKGIFSAREAVVMQQQRRGIMDANADDEHDPGVGRPGHRSRHPAVALVGSAAPACRRLAALHDRHRGGRQR